VTSQFDGRGNFSLTNAITPGQPRQFFRLKILPRRVFKLRTERGSVTRSSFDYE